MQKEFHPEQNRKNSFSDELEQAIEDILNKNIHTYGDLLEDLSGRRQVLGVLILCLPLLIPTPIPGIPIPCGILVALIGFRLALGLDLWLPKFLAAKPLSNMFLRLLQRSFNAIQWLERFVHPRLRFLSQHTWLIRLHGALIGICGLIIAIPLPPGTNIFPAIAIFLLALGTLEDDGLLITLGYLVLFLNLVFFAALFAIGWNWFDHVRKN